MKLKRTCFLMGFFLLITMPNIFAERQSVSQEPKLLTPEHLRPGDTVGLISSAFRAPDDEAIQYAAERLQALGLKVKFGQAIFKNNAYFPGTDQERAADVNAMFADPQVKAIFEVRGGWGSNRILPYLNFKLIQEHPKILIGF